MSVESVSGREDGRIIKHRVDGGDLESCDRVLKD
jgi:hypothetical protein